MKRTDKPILPDPPDGASALNAQLLAAYNLLTQARGSLTNEQWEAFCSILERRLAQRIG